MDEYTIFCTEEQAKKALELGAPTRRILPTEAINDPSFEMSEHFSDRPIPYFVKIPTAEQMIGWLRSKGFRFKITEFEEGTLWKVAHGDWFDFSDNDGVNPKDATLAAIDAALEYLTDKNK